MDDRDSTELRQFGYAQQLRRSLGGFSSFAVAFSLISVFTGVSANFGHGLRQVGGGLVWSWLVVLAGQMLVALVLAELSTRIPLSGYGYQWTSRLVNPHFGFAVGWLLVLQFLTGFPGVCATLATQLGHWLGSSWAEPRVLTALTLAIIAVTALVHLFGIRTASLVNNTGVWTELIGVAGLSLVLILLALSRGAPVERLWDPAGAASTTPGWLAMVAEGQRTPRNAILFIWAVSSGVVIGLPSLDVITQISAVAGYLGYAGIIAAALLAPPAPPGDGFRLGRARPWIAGAALLWTLGVVAALTLPPTPVAGLRTLHLPAISTSVGIGLGLILYLAIVGPRLRRGQAGPPSTPRP